MRRLGFGLISVDSALWAGGNIAIFVAALALFEAVDPDRTLGGRVFGQIFSAWFAVTWVLTGIAAVALVAVALPRPGRRRPSTVATAVLAIAVLACQGVGAVTLSEMVSLREQIYERGETTAEVNNRFVLLHRRSETTFSVQTVTLLGLAAIAGVAAARGPRDDRRAG